MITIVRVSALLLAASLVNASTATAQTQQAQISSAAKGAFAANTAHPLIKKGLAFLEAVDANTLNDQKTMTVIPAPPFKEQKRAEYYRARLQELGLQDVRIDSEGNAIGLRRGTGNGPTLIVSAHLDTVFPEGSDVTSRSRKKTTGSTRQGYRTTREG